jgi:hypothetical protein
MILLVHTGHLGDSAGSYSVVFFVYLSLCERETLTIHVPRKGTQGRATLKDRSGDSFRSALCINAVGGGRRQEWKWDVQDTQRGERRVPLRRQQHAGL